MLKRTGIILIVLMSLCLTAKADSERTVYDKAGKLIGREVTDSKGSKTLYNMEGKIIGRMTIDDKGNATFYDDMGNAVGGAPSSVIKK